MTAVGKMVLAALVIGVGTLGYQHADHTAEQRLAEATRISTGAIPRAKPQPAVAADATSPAIGTADMSRTRHVDLSRDLHKALAKVGCFHGDIGSAWGEASRKSMHAFNAAVGSSLAADQPNHILLTMVEGYQGKACGDVQAAAAMPAIDDHPSLPPVDQVSPIEPQPAPSASLSARKPDRRPTKEKRTTAITKRVVVDSARLTDADLRRRDRSVADASANRRSSRATVVAAASRPAAPRPPSSAPFDGRALFNRLDRS